MLRRLIALLVIVALAGGSPALADFNRSMKWFEGLSDEAKVDIQSNLVLLAHYGAFVDGEFGPSTYRAIVAFQESSGGVATGELTETQLTLLSNASEAVVTSLGIEFVRDPRAGLAIAVPVGILPNRQQTENGSLFLNADGSFTLEVFGVPDGDTTLGGMFAYANRNDPGRRVTYSVLREERYVVSGIDDGHYFYEMGFPLVGQTSGFRYRYPGTERYVGGIVSVYSASYVLPLAFGTVAGTPWIGLPGNPGASLVTALIIARPALLAAQGQRDAAARVLPVTADFEWTRTSVRTRYLQARLEVAEGRLAATLHREQSSAMLANCCWADGMVVIPADQTISRGATVEFIPYQAV